MERNLLMNTCNFLMRMLAVLTILIAGLVLQGCQSKAPREEGISRIAVVIDSSGSFQENLSTASRIVSRYIRENALSGYSEVYLIAMDRKPHVIERYGADEFMDAESNQALEDMQNSVSPEDGTDVVGALRLASMKLLKNTGEAPSDLTLLCFSDMHVDPATVAGGKTSFQRLEEMDWQSLQANKIACRFYFVAPDMEATLINLTHDLDATVLDATESRRLVL